MPRKARTVTTPKQLKQKKLDAFLSSSPAPSTQSSPARPTRASKRTQIRAAASDDDVPGPSQVSVDGDGSQSSDAGAIHFEPQVVEISSSEDEGDFAPRSTFSSKGKKRLRRAHSDESASVASSSGGDGRELYIRRGKRAAKKTPAVLDSDEDEEETHLPKKRKLVKGERPQTPEADEVDLIDEVDEKRIIESRLRKRDKRSAFQRNLEKLKKKKRGEAIESDRASGSEDETEEEAAPFPQARPDDGSADAEAAAEEDEDGFIVEDDADQSFELPAEYSMNTYQDLLHHFKIICQLFVHMAVHDADEREDTALQLLNNQYFAVPLKITRRKLSGMRDSLVAGSTWKTHFRKAFDIYPEFELHDLDFVVAGCDACNLGARKSTKQGTLSGEPYEPLTYATIADGASDGDEGEDSGGPKKVFDLGRFCAKRTRTYHKFTHWEYHLFHSMREEVDSLKGAQSGRSFVRVAYAKGRQPPEDLSDADAIMDWLDERQVINLQWQEVKMMMDDARHLEVKGGRGADGDPD